MINRTLAPEFKTIDKIDIIQASKQTLDNGIPVYSINSGSQELVKIEFVFKAGMYYQNQPLVASAANNLSETGTKKYTANQLSDNIDYYGAFFECEVGQDFSSLTLFSLNKFLNETMVYVEDILKNPTFPKDEFDIYITNKKQKHIVNSQKVNVIARRKFSELLFGEQHPYGIDVTNDHFDNLQLDTIREFHSTHYNSANCTIIISGKLPQDLLSVLNQYFGKSSWGNTEKVNKPFIEFNTTTEKKIFIEKTDAIQSAIRVGRPLFNKTHVDYYKFQVLNTILGGYFGSRLMANIREDKGYTYGIGSGLASFVHGGYFYISTEVGADVTTATLTEIYTEIELLKTELVDANELETVCNYILGQFLRTVDGPFSLADKFRSIWEFNLDYSHYDHFFNAVKNITPKEIQQLANNYLKKEDLIECVVGKLS